jgi:diguanylate cyclase (GGDEF)-like protein
LLSGGLVVLVVGIALLLWQRRMNLRLDRASRTDPLTGLPNRRDLVAQLDSAQRSGQGRYALLLIDVDHFKQINDRHGHDAGDRVLCEIAQRLARACGSGSSVARWGGEEFLMRVPVTDAASAGGIAERWRCQLSQPITLGEELIAVQVSIGFCALPLFTDDDDCGWQDSLNLADQALYMAKAAGRNGWAGIWGDRSDASWPASRVAAELAAARLQRVVTLHSLRPLPESLHAVA